MLAPWLLALASSDLDWRAAPGCPDAHEVSERLGAMLSPEAVAAIGRTRISVDVLQRGPHWEARIYLDDGRGPSERSFAATSCDAVTDAALLLIAMAIDPRFGGAPVPVPEPVESIDPPAPVEPAPAELTIAPASTPAPAKRRVQGLIGASAGVGFAVMPRAAAVLRLGGGVVLGRVALLLDAQAWLPRGLDSQSNPAVGARASAWTLGPRGCVFAVARRRVALPLCVGAHGGQIVAQGTGALQPRRRAAPWGHASVGAGAVVWVVPRLGLGVEVEALVPWVRPAFATDPSGIAFRVPVASARGSLGVIVRWP